MPRASAGSGSSCRSTAQISLRSDQATKQAVLVEGEFDCLVWWSWALSAAKQSTGSHSGHLEASPMTSSGLRELAPDRAPRSLTTISRPPGHAAAVSLRGREESSPASSRCRPAVRPDEVSGVFGPKSGLETLRSMRPELRGVARAALGRPLSAHTRGRAAAILAEARRTGGVRADQSGSPAIRSRASTHAWGRDRGRSCRTSSARAVERAGSGAPPVPTWRGRSRRRPRTCRMPVARGHAISSPHVGGTPIESQRPDLGMLAAEGRHVGDAGASIPRLTASPSRRSPRDRESWKSTVRTSRSSSPPAAVQRAHLTRRSDQAVLFIRDPSSPGHSARSRLVGLSSGRVQPLPLLSALSRGDAPS